MGSEVEIAETGSPDEVRGYDSYEVTLGDHLRGERATHGKSLLDVQRDLRIRASYIAAIENSDLAVFPNPGFVAGYVRSYARYLKLDPEDVFRRFCAESGFTGVNGGIQTKKAEGGSRIVASGPLRVAPDDPLTKSFRVPASDLQPGLLERFSISAIGSVAVLLVLIAGVGYGGYRVLQNIQRVTIAPVEQRPDTFADVAPLIAPGIGGETSTTVAEDPERDTDLARLYRPRELDVPVVEQRDGPIVDIDPREAGVFAPPREPEEAAAPARLATAAPTADALAEPPGLQVRAPTGVPQVYVVARQPAWVRVYQDDGTVLFEKILDTGETYTLPKDAEAPLLRAGNAGAVFLLLDDAPFGPLGDGPTVAKQVSLIPGDIREAWPAVTDPPDVIQETLSALAVSPTEAE